VRRVELAAVGVNKAADYYMKAEEVLSPASPPPRAPTATPVADPDESPPAGNRVTRAAGETHHRPKSTLERLREEEAKLDAALARSGQRFASGDLTAREMHRECDQLVEVFNRQVMSENIRYRSMLRGRSNPNRRIRATRLG
jgi:hypothetical protein